VAEVGKEYPSKKDTGLVVLMWVCVVGIIYATVQFGLDIRSPLAILAFVIFCTVPVVVLCLWTLFDTRYILTHKELVVRGGPRRERIPLQAILEVIPQRTPLSSPALSMDRLYITWQKGRKRSVYISPDNRKSFLRNLAARAGLKQDGDRLFREEAS
jgi:hypothetical protein